MGANKFGGRDKLELPEKSSDDEEEPNHELSIYDTVAHKQSKKSSDS